jgi:uncharacterized protein YjbJ (UPF0337 family)
VTDDKNATEQEVHDEVEQARGVSHNAAVGQAQEEKLKGVAEDVKGRAEEVTGKALDREDVAAKGQAEEDEAQERRNAAKNESLAEQSRG